MLVIRFSHVTCVQKLLTGFITYCILLPSLYIDGRCRIATTTSGSFFEMVGMLAKAHGQSFHT